MDTSDNDNFISDDNIIRKYKKELYTYINYSDEFGYDTIYYTDASSNHKNSIFSLENIKQNKIEKTGKTIFIKLEGYGDYQISIHKVHKPNNFIGELMNNFFKAHMDNINNYLLGNIHLESVKNGIYFNRNFEHEKIKKQNKQNKLFIPKNFKQMCMLLGLEIRTYTNMDCNYENKIVIKNNLVVDMSYKQINLYKLMFCVIFGDKYSNMINYKIIKDDGNFILTIFEFCDSYYIIDYQTS
jgi:hypothetical protein